MVVCVVRVMSQFGSAARAGGEGRGEGGEGRRRGGGDGEGQHDVGSSGDVDGGGGLERLLVLVKGAIASTCKGSDC